MTLPPMAIGASRAPGAPDVERDRNSGNAYLRGAGPGCGLDVVQQPAGEDHHPAHLRSHPSVAAEGEVDNVVEGLVECVQHVHLGFGHICTGAQATRPVSTASDRVYTQRCTAHSEESNI